MAVAVYLVHYQVPRAHHRHALRTAKLPADQIRKLYKHLHQLPIDAKARQAGVGFLHVRNWFGEGELLERRLKRQKHHSRLCPVCNPKGFAKRTSRMLKE